MGSVRRTAETFKIEEAYEFCAPQFVDFTTTNTRVIDNLPDHFVDFGKNDVDDWFDICHSSDAEISPKFSEGEVPASVTASGRKVTCSTPRSTLTSKIAVLPDTVTKRVPLPFSTSDVQSSVGSLLSRPFQTASPIVQKSEKSSNVFCQSKVIPNVFKTERTSMVQVAVATEPPLSSNRKRRASVYDRLFQMTKKQPKTFNEPTQKIPKKPSATLTVPKSPKFATTLRSRRMETKLAKHNATHERNLKLTRPRSPILSTKLRSKPSTKQTPVKSVSFKAKPVSKEIFARPLGIPPKRSTVLTVPETPAFLRRYPPKKDPKNLGKENISTNNAKALPKTDTSKPLEKVQVRPLTVPQSPCMPGKTISLQKRIAFTKEIERKLEEEKRARQFKAQSQTTATCPLPRVKPKPLTRPKSPKFMVDLRGSTYQKRLQEEIARQEAEASQSRLFHAKPCGLKEQPFFPKPSTKPPTRRHSIHLSTEARCKDRENFEQHLRQKEAEAARLRAEAEQTAKAQEAVEIRRLRAQLVHKAQPIRRYSSVEVRKSERPLTLPISPQLQTSRRAAAHK